MEENFYPQTGVEEKLQVDSRTAPKTVLKINLKNEKNNLEEKAF